MELGERYDHFGETVVVTAVSAGGRIATLATATKDPFGKETLHSHREYHVNAFKRMRRLYPCKVCGDDMGWDRPSGVCSAGCLAVGQGFTK